MRRTLRAELLAIGVILTAGVVWVILLIAAARLWSDLYLEFTLIRLLPLLVLSSAIVGAGAFRLKSESPRARLIRLIVVGALSSVAVDLAVFLALARSMLAQFSPWHTLPSLLLTGAIIGLLSASLYARLPPELVAVTSPIAFFSALLIVRILLTLLSESGIPFLNQLSAFAHPASHLVVALALVTLVGIVIGLIIVVLVMSVIRLVQAAHAGFKPAA